MSQSPIRPAMPTNGTRPDPAILFDTLLENLPYAVSLFDEKFNLIRCNREFLRLLKYEENLAKPGTHISEIFRASAEQGVYGPGKLQDHIASRMEIVTKREVRHYERVRPDGRVVEVFYRPLADGGLIVTCNNITQRRETEEFLRSSRQKIVEELALSEIRFKDFAEAGADWLWEMDDVFQFTWFSGHLDKIRDLSAEDIIGRSRRELLAGDPRSEAWQRHQADLDAHRPFQNFEYTIEDQDGTLTHVSTSGKPFFDRQGNFAGYRGIGRDVTAIKIAEQAVREKTRSLELLQHVATVTNEADSIEMALQNSIDAICEFTGWPIGHACLTKGRAVDRLYPTNIWHLADPDRLHDFRTETENLEFTAGQDLPGLIMTSGRPEWLRNAIDNVEYRRFSSANHNICAGFGIPVLANKVVTGVLEFYTDQQTGQDPSLLDLMLHVGEIVGRVVERKMSEDQIRQSQQQFKDYADTAADWFWETGPDLSFTYVSEQFDEISGNQRSLFVGKLRTGSRTDGLGGTAWKLHLDDLKHRRQFQNFRYAARSSDGNIHYISTSGKPRFDDDGNFLGYRGSATDISGQVSNMQSLREAKEHAEFANRTKTAFLANMSHELRTPLNAIIGFSEIMTLAAVGKVENPTHLSYIHDIHDAGTHLLAVINDILDVARVEAGELEVSDNEIDIGLLTQNSIDMVWAQAQKAGIKIELNMPDDFPMLRADRTRVKQVLLNLVINAVKFSNSGGLVNVTSSMDRDRIQISVSDNGIGIAEDDLQGIFEPFTQVHDVFSRPHEGSGLGLSLVKSMMELHGGSIVIDSEPGRGTTATLTFPPERTIRLKQFRLQT